MVKLFTRALLSGAILFGLGTFASASAQDRDGYYRHDRDDYNRMDRVTGLMQRVGSDLDRAAGDSYFIHNRGDRRRLEHAREEINEFQSKWSNGRYDRRELDDVIGSVQSVVDHNRANWRDRDRLADDLNRLRDFRAWRENSFRDRGPDYVPGYYRR